MLITEHEFELPIGYVDKDGTLHRAGAMRLATAADEILPMKDPRVQNLPAYLIVILLSRVIVRLGALPQINPGIIEGIFSEDLAFLQDMYNTINGLSNRQSAVRCEKCGETLELEGAPPGILGYPLEWVYQEVAALSTRVHWTYNDVLSLDHSERRRWLEEILKLEEGK